MVEFIEDTVNQTCICRSDKLVTDILIEKANDGFIFFEFRVTKGSVPKELSGKYSSINKAKEAVTAYLNKKNDTVAAKNVYFAKSLEERKKINASKHQWKSS